MKSNAAVFLRHVLTVLTTMAKTKTMALKRKTRALKTRLVIFSLLHNKKIPMTSISQKVNALMVQSDKRSHCEEDDHDVVDKGKSIELYNCNSSSMPLPQLQVVDDEEEEWFPDPAHSMFGESVTEEELEDAGGSVIDLVKLSKEDDIDRAADLYIKRFHHQIWMEKQLSLKRHQGTGEGEHLLNI